MRLLTLFTPAIILMSSMKYPKKLALATAVFFLPFVLFLYLGYDHIESESHSITKLQDGLAYLRKVRLFLEYVPLERGMTVAMQQGDTTYKSKIEANFKRIDSAIADIDAATAPTSSTHEEWMAIKSQWQYLQSGIWDRTSSENYRLHTELIEKTLLLMQHTGDVSYTINDADLTIYHLVKILSDHIPMLVEYTGQGRAIGTKVLLKQTISLEEQKEATLLYGKIRSHLDSIVYDGAIVCERHPELCTSINPSILGIEKDCERFSIVFTSQILNTDHWQINSNDYFYDVTQTIQTYFNAYDVISAALQIHLEKRLDNLKKQMIVGEGIALVILAALIYFTIGFYLAFMGVLDELVGAARLISSGKYVVRVPIKTDDEMADVSHAFNEMAQKIGQSFAFLKSYKKAVDASNLLSITDINGNIIYVNDQFCMTTGYTREELIGHNHRILKDSDTPKELYEEMWKTILNKNIWSGTLKNLAKNGRPYYTDSTITPIVDEEGNIVEFVATRHDITQLILQKEQLIQQLYTDTLTQLPNRTKLLEDLALMTSPILILVNIDRFGEINDFYGTEIGDSILKGMERRIATSNMVASSYKLYRIYADEFALLCDEKCFNNQPHEEVIASLHTHIESNPFYVNGAVIMTRVTLGAVIDPMRDINEHLSVSQLLIDSDMALRHAKQNDKEFVILNDTAKIRKEISHNIEFTGKIKEAITSNRIVPFFQGILENKSADTFHAGYYSQAAPTKYECLIRIIGTDGKVISPFIFLEVAKKAKLYAHLTRIMIEKSFEIFQKNSYDFSINLSVEDILDPKTVQFIFDKLENQEIAKRVIFEILESEGFDNFEEVQEFIQQIKQRGGRIAIDDFGSGYSNFAYILHLQVDFLKIDASLIKNIDTDINSRIIVETIVAFAQRLGIKTIAEFVHSKEVYEIVKEIGIDYSQGFYFHEPSQYL
ncbi:EAL domain-containing protein [Sulfuricurvum sp.]|uniref:EAL domain-containing protein n=1 Tax=Sulfuricurvum sp. TaxID=2025608 RepID=UPI002D5C57BB|nr:EAL domain-containing protein [Sulfuricurvum sp.]HZF69404.1 EAL domain-containing protein [Sulfuricurvum sp.]